MVEQETTELTVQWTGISSRQALLALNKIPDIKAKTLARLIGRQMRQRCNKGFVEDVPAV
jgi:hypothetical protein